MTLLSWLRLSPASSNDNTRGSNNPKFPDPANKNRPPQPEDYPPLRTKPMEIDQTHNHNRKDRLNQRTIHLSEPSPWK
ncbi:hypothetical protein H5410_055950 [Solanum commersonii]|uniref:Uncharacterized protein n=1 Tax=Solanum commersonii TaxID=4109 RepID=A0A9J5WLA9_SOLCO|nr:hypothetical protein H5410_055950 [Solanum commersonii]